MSEPEYEQPFINKEVLRDIEFLEANSPDIVTDMGILMHVIFKRIFRPANNPYYGWTDCAVTWFAESSKMGYRRIKASLDRLEEWGIIKGMSTNNDPTMAWSRRAPRYRYDLRDYPAKAETASHTRAHEQVTKRPQVQPPKRVEELTTIISQPPIIARPPLKAGPDGGYGEVWILDKDTQRMIPTQVAPSDFVQYPICKGCHRAFHPTQGTAGEFNGDMFSPPRTGFCSDCFTVAAVKHALEKDMRRAIDIYTPAGGSLELKTRDEMREYLTSRDIPWIPNPEEAARG